MTDEPLDTQIDRRAFLTRMAAASTIAAGGVAVAAEARPRRSAIVAPAPDDLEDLTELTLAQTAAAIRDGRISSEEAVGAHLERIERFEPTYLAFNTVLAEQALARARLLDRRRPEGVLHGVPIVVKDNYWTKGIETTANSHIFEGFVPDEDATCVARLLDEGAVLLGKTQMGPLATTRATTPDGLVTTVNAWTPNTPAYDPGGSSSGSATAVAGRLACSSIGTQTGGSITSPSNQQGLTGLKPTMGRTSLYGIIPLTYSRDHAGPLARDARDAAIMTEVLAGPDPRDPRTEGLPRVPDLVRAAEPGGSTSRPQVRWRTTVGVPPGYTSGSSAAAPARQAMLDAFDDLGVEVREIVLPEEWDLLTSGTFNNVRLPERTEPFLPYLKQDLRLFGVSLNSWMQGLFLAGDEWIKGQRAKHVLLTRVLGELFDQCDVVLQTSPVPFDIIGLPEIAFPIGFEVNAASGREVPIGAIVGGQPYAEDRLLALAGAYQAATGWHLRRPADPAPAPAARTARPRLTAEDVERLTQ
jgi:Asp-tRNA(Asn)/Glu-tRNA(Gln) amidotransferase A subunit family amidase